MVVEVRFEEGGGPNCSYVSEQFEFELIGSRIHVKPLLPSPGSVSKSSLQDKSPRCRSLSSPLLSRDSSRAGGSSGKHNCSHKSTTLPENLISLVIQKLEELEGLKNEDSGFSSTSWKIQKVSERESNQECDCNSPSISHKLNKKKSTSEEDVSYIEKFKKFEPDSPSLITKLNKKQKSPPEKGREVAHIIEEVLKKCECNSPTFNTKLNAKRSSSEQEREPEDIIEEALKKFEELYKKENKGERITNKNNNRKRWLDREDESLTKTEVNEQDSLERFSQKARSHLQTYDTDCAKYSGSSRKLSERNYNLKKDSCKGNVTPPEKDEGCDNNICKFPKKNLKADLETPKKSTVDPAVSEPKKVSADSISYIKCKTTLKKQDPCENNIDTITSEEKILVDKLVQHIYETKLKCKGAFAFKKLLEKRRSDCEPSSKKILIDVECWAISDDIKKDVEPISPEEKVEAPPKPTVEVEKKKEPVVATPTVIVEAPKKEPVTAPIVEEPKKKPVSVVEEKEKPPPQTVKIVETQPVPKTPPDASIKNAGVSQPVQKTPPDGVSLKSSATTLYSVKLKPMGSTLKNEPSNVTNSSAGNSHQQEDEKQKKGEKKLYTFNKVKKKGNRTK